MRVDSSSPAVRRRSIRRPSCASANATSLSYGFAASCSGARYGACGSNKWIHANQGLVVGCWLLGAGGWLLVTGGWGLGVVCWLLAAGCWGLEEVEGSGR